MRHLVIAAAVAVGLAACSAPADEPSSAPSETAVVEPSDSPTPMPSVEPGVVLTSPDFADGGELEDWATANAFDGQCTGDNLNPALEWGTGPDGTQSFAIVMLDRSANNFIHWVHFDIPADVTGVARGGSVDLAGADGVNTSPAGSGYFGPCPPGADHRYEFTVYALDAMLGLSEGARFAEVKAAIDEHLLASASIVGMRSGPAEG
jgi:Raf kinase inhibitor-like YbhB/YbcL family protein